MREKQREAAERGVPAIGWCGAAWHGVARWHIYRRPRHLQPAPRHPYRAVFCPFVSPRCRPIHRQPSLPNACTLPPFLTPLCALLVSSFSVFSSELCLKEDTFSFLFPLVYPLRGLFFATSPHQLCGWHIAASDSWEQSDLPIASVGGAARAIYRVCFLVLGMEYKARRRFSFNWEVVFLLTSKVIRCSNSMDEKYELFLRKIVSM